MKNKYQKVLHGIVFTEECVEYYPEIAILLSFLEFRYLPWLKAYEVL